MREGLKQFVRLAASIAVLPALASYKIRALFIGRNRALEGSSQMLALIPGLAGQYLRRAFLARTLAACHPTAAICFGTLFSQPDARIDEHVYIGPGCHIGLTHVERDALIASGVHVTSGRHTHGTEDPVVPIREQEGQRALVRIGAGAWIGSGAVVMADVGRNAIVGAGSVVTRPIPDSVVAAGVPARVIRTRIMDEVSARSARA
jgi:acetyltransferase-like isoleucine patch superfamily enzyme